MRKFLSLVLALVMTMSLVTISAGAKEFTDADAINYDEAVDVISALGVVDGYAGGEFGPSGILTRQAAAKIICNLILGPTTAHALSADAAPFPDVPTSSEFAGYIAYCAQQGIIGGYPDGNFRPGGSLTGYAFMKMLLGALGYDAAIEGFGGANWSINVGKLAIGIGLNKGLLEGFDGSKAVTREEAALYARNTLTATMVQYDDRIIVSGTDGSQVTVGGSKAKDMAGNTNDGNIELTKDDKTGYKDDLLQFAERYFDNLKMKDDTDDFGRPSNTWTIRNEKIGTYGKASELVASYTTKATKGNIYDLLSSSVRDDIEKGKADFTVHVDGVEITEEKTAIKVEDGKTSYTIVPDPSNPKNFYERNSSAEIYTPVEGSTRRGTLTEVYVDSDNNVDIVFVNTYVFQATSDYSESRNDVKMTPKGDTALNLKGGELTLNGDDFNLTDIKTDDYLLITAASDTWGSNYEVKSVKVAEKVTGEVTGYAEGDSVTIDGTTYNYSATALKFGPNENIRKTTYTVGQDAIVVVDEYNNIIAIDEAVSSSSFVFIKQFGVTSSVSSKAVANAYFTDGTNEEITIDKVDSTKSVNSIDKLPDNDWYTYSINSDGKYVLYSLASGRSNKEATYAAGDVKDGQIVFNGKVDFMAAPANKNDKAGIANDKTIMVVVDKDGDVMTYTGTANIPDITLGGADTATVYWVLGNKGYAEYAFVDMENKNDSTVVDGGDDTSFMYVLRFKDTLNSTGANKYYTYTVISEDDGVDVKVPFESQYSHSGEAEDGIYKYQNVGAGKHPYQLFYKPRYNSDDRISNITIVPDNASDKYFNHAVKGADVKYGDGSLTIGNENFVVTSDSKITLVIRKDDTTRDMLADKGADHEIYSNTAATNVNSLLKDKKINGNIAGATSTSTSRVIDTLYITVDSVGNGGGQQPPADDEYTVTVKGDGDDQTIKTKKGTDFTYTASKEITSAKIDGVDVGTIAGNKVTIPEATASGKTVVLTLKEESGAIDDFIKSVTVKLGDTELAVTAAHVLTADDVKNTVPYGPYAPGGSAVGSAGDLYIEFAKPADGTGLATSVTGTVRSSKTDFGSTFTNAAAGRGDTYSTKIATAGLAALLPKMKTEKVDIVVNVTAGGYPVDVSLPTGYYQTAASADNDATLAVGGAQLKFAFNGVKTVLGEGVKSVEVKLTITGVEGAPITKTLTQNVESDGNTVKLTNINSGNVTPTGAVTITVNEIKAKTVGFKAVPGSGHNVTTSLTAATGTVGTKAALPDLDVQAWKNSAAVNVVNGTKARITFTVDGIKETDNEFTTKWLTAGSNKYTLDNAAFASGAKPEITPDGSGAVTITITKVEYFSVQATYTALITSPGTAGDKVNTGSTGSAATPADVEVSDGKFTVRLTLSDAAGSGKAANGVYKVTCAGMTDPVTTANIDVDHQTITFEVTADDTITYNFVVTRTGDLPTNP